jgi:hypothetical protein
MWSEEEPYLECGSEASAFPGGPLRMASIKAAASPPEAGRPPLRPSQRFAITARRTAASRSG